MKYSWSYWWVKVKVTQLCPTLCNPIDCSQPGSSVHGILQARTLEWVAIPFSGYFPNPRTEPTFPTLILCRLSHQGSPRILEWVAYPFSSGSSWPRNRTAVSCTAGGFFTSWFFRATREALVILLAVICIGTLQGEKRDVEKEMHKVVDGH